MSFQVIHFTRKFKQNILKTTVGAYHSFWTWVWQSICQECKRQPCASLYWFCFICANDSKLFSGMLSRCYLKYKSDQYDTDNWSHRWIKRVLYVRTMLCIVVIALPEILRRYQNPEECWTSQCPAGQKQLIKSTTFMWLAWWCCLGVRVSRDKSTSRSSRRVFQVLPRKGSVLGTEKGPGVMNRVFVHFLRGSTKNENN